MNASVTRRDAVLGIAAAATSFAVPSILRAQSAGRVVVVGGGFGGAACARALKRAEANLQVILIEPSTVFTSCPFSNEVIAGLREIDTQQFGYDKIAAEGVTVISQAVTTIEPQLRSVVTADGVALPYDRLVLSPGIDFHFEALPGYDDATSEKMPHAWKAGAQTLLLRRQLEAMPDGGTVAIAIPANPSRCPPAPYERASLIAHYLKTKKPRSKVLILDAKDNFSQQRLFEKAWKELYGDMIERIGLSQGGRVTSVDPATRTIVTEFGNYTPDVANVIPPQRAGRIAEVAGAADATGWCPIDPVTFESKLVQNIHVIGDACLGGGIPKSASAASAQGKACASVIVNLLAGRAPETPRLTGVCYNIVAPGYGFSLAGNYQPRGDIFAEVEGGTSSPVDAPRELRAREATEAEHWFQTITADTFG
ncbi:MULTISPECIES: NAD(P)/FAD-dependent oxidoreductase [unclassified Bradyrhizobium]|jgi:sulfide dehydrogenase [flavocytochrome c] flavoprotein subunit|uniref:NAD(P)/FAD-dependent oxidoreductase n=2 Tax=Bradyrhizobium TaxID=374 RepID=UPI001FF89155|nr:MULTISPECIES: NAD(P)/FAD-dependent oxidoreductase [unclassified Bradyrhizobium]MCK1292963.1 FAD-dependent oxidoreductase [Bradyrhizobium sp. 30]MCK1331229.1 FAD-dependent oxidoreductase [Bradyrhizobium sp. CW9]MCK1504212.1 FAD-dependent oxidoreductase [Bradyrhizobium sp. 18]MCK1520690.1 FAD-dependent oxidoreductase [Bradyrhizobium sp. 17]MCK1633459.1 FAD-dependent oxidoreductase [Bradyrhizobium sp. 162]